VGESFISGSHQRARHIRIVENCFDCRHQCVDVTGLSPLGSSGENFRERTGSGGDDGNARRHCLEWWDAESLKQRGIDECLRASEKIISVGVGEPTGAADPRAVGRSVNDVANGVDAPSVGASNDEVQVWSSRSDHVERAHK
jgi:hypothetical protein